MLIQFWALFVLGFFAILSSITVGPFVLQEASAATGNTEVKFVQVDINGNPQFSILDPDLLDKDTSLPGGLIAFDCSIFQAFTVDQGSLPLEITINDCGNPSDETRWHFYFHLNLLKEHKVHPMETRQITLQAHLQKFQDLL